MPMTQDQPAVEEYLTELRRRQDRIRPDILPDRPRYPLGELSLPAHVAHWAARDPDRAAVVFYGAETSYAELDEASDRLAGRLESAGVGPGDRVGVHLPNCPQFLVAFLAVLRLGAVHVPVNPLFRAAELRHELRDAAPGVVITLDTLAPALLEIRAQTPVREVLVTSLADVLPVEPTLPLPPQPSDGTVAPVPSRWAQALAHPRLGRTADDLDALAALNYTGGTTGLPKGCEHTQRHMLYTAAAVWAGSGCADGEPLNVLCYLPVFWIAGENLGILAPLVSGGTSVLLSRWDPEAVLLGVERYNVSVLTGTVENYQELLDHPAFAKRDLSSLTGPTVISFIRKLTPELRHRWREAVGEGSVLREASYGMTETHTSDTLTLGFQDDDRDLRTEPVFCGLPVPGTDIMVVGFGTGEPLPLGEQGEIVLRGPSLLTGYWRQPEATALALRDGWLHTGDIGMLDEDGCLHYLGRAKDMIKVSGMSVFPSEVEALLGQHEDVVAAAVVAVEDAERGQSPYAFVRVRAGADVTAEGLRAWARENMAVYKVPAIELVDGFPLTATGKIRKVELAERAAGAAGAAGRP
ncbi:AMP-binding protein [Streptomyces daliensis]